MSADLKDRILTYATDSDFIQWVRTGYRHDNDRWHNLREDSETSALIEEAIQLVTALDFSQEAINPSRKKALFGRIRQDIDTLESTDQETKTFSIRRLWPALTVAASFLILVSIFLPGSNSSEILSTPYASTLDHTLPDNSIVTINADSKLEYTPRSFLEQRSIELEGEAYFNVEKGSAFVVTTPDIKVEVLGTSFNVFSRDGYAEVFCETGKVRVSQKSTSSSIVLSPGESAVLDSNVLSKKKTLLSKEWHKGEFKFDNAPLDLVLEELKRQYKIDIIIPEDLEDMPYTGFFEKENLEKALQSILWPLSLNYTIDPGGSVRIGNN